MARGEDLYNIVVLGAMNPSIHHASWYRLVELCSPEEADAAAVRPNSFASRAVSQVDFGDYIVTCHEQRWEIATKNENRIDRILDLAGRIFDEVLLHTPVAAMGFNFIYFREEADAKLAVSLATRIGSALDIDSDGASSGTLAIRRHSGGRLCQVTLEIPEGSDTVQVRNNFEYRLDRPSFEFFKLADTIAERHPKDRAEAIAQTDRVVHSLCHAR